jgi:hypothetical protein
MSCLALTMVDKLTSTLKTWAENTLTSPATRKYEDLILLLIVEVNEDPVPARRILQPSRRSRRLAPHTRALSCQVTCTDGHAILPRVGLEVFTALRLCRLHPVAPITSYPKPLFSLLPLPSLRLDSTPNARLSTPPFSSCRRLQKEHLRHLPLLTSNR